MQITIVIRADVDNVTAARTLARSVKTAVNGIPDLDLSASVSASISTDEE